MVREPTTRRRVLRTGGQLAAVGTIVGTAGCLSDVPVVGDILGGGPLPPKKWVAAPGVFSDEEHGFFSYQQPKKMLEQEDSLPSEVVDNLEEENSRNEITGVAPEDVAAKVSVGFGTYSVWKANFNKDDVTGELEDNDFEDEGDHEGFTVFVGADDSDYAGQAVGVSGGKLVFGRKLQDMDAQEAVEAAIDVSKGNEDRYADESDAMKTLMNKAGTAHRVFGRTSEPPEDPNPEQGQFEGNVGNGSKLQVNGETTKIDGYWVFEDSDAADKGDVEDWIEKQEDEDGSVVEKANSVNVNKSGKTIVVKIDIDTDEYYEDRTSRLA